MKSCAWVSKNGRISEADGIQPRDALLSATGTATSEDLLLQQRISAEQNIRLIRSRLAEATWR